MVGVIRINVLCIVLVTSSMIVLREMHRQSVGPIEPGVLTFKLISYYIVLILKNEENPSTRRKTLKAHERSTTGTLSREKPHQTWLRFFSGERHNELNTCETRASSTSLTNLTVIFLQKYTKQL